MKEAEYAKKQLTIMASEYKPDTTVYRILSIMLDRIIYNYLNTFEERSETSSARASINYFRDIVKGMEDQRTNPVALLKCSDDIRQYKDTKMLNLWQREELIELLLRLQFVETR